MQAPRLFALFAVLIGLIVAGTAPATAGRAPTSGVQRWASVSTATITPGVQMYTDGAQCTGNFVFTDRKARVYVGYAAHCAGLGEATDTNGCDTDSVALGTPVRFASGGTIVSSGTTVGQGRLVYSSWRTMREIGTKDARACDYNDFALVRVRKRDIRKVNPSVPFWGGPVGLAKSGAPEGSQVFSWGQSSLRPTTALSPREGISLGSNGDGWSYDVYTVSPGVPGDSGSGFLDADGAALGILSTVQFAPLVASNGVGDLRHELRFAKRHSGIRGLRLVKGTQKFSSRF